MRRSSPPAANRRSRRLALEVLEARVPVSEGFGAFLTVSALSAAGAVARSRAALFAPSQLDNAPGRSALQQENTSRAVSLTPTKQVALVPPAAHQAPQPAAPTWPGFSDLERDWLDDLATNLGDFFRAPRQHDGGGFAGGGSAALAELGGLSLAPPAAGDFRPETNSQETPRAADQGPAADLAVLAGLNGPSDTAPDDAEDAGSVVSAAALTPTLTVRPTAVPRRLPRPVVRPLQPPRPLPPRQVAPRRSGVSTVLSSGASASLWVLDYKDRLVLTQGVIEHEFAGWSADLRAQVSGARVQSYQWCGYLGPGA